VTPGAEQVLSAIRSWQTESVRARSTPRHPTLVVAIDGYGASGKTTLAAEVAGKLGAVVLHTDDHFHDARATDDPRPMAQYYDWSALRSQASAGAAELVLVEGVSSAAPALADLITHTVFIATPEPVRLERLHARISDEEWDEEWLAAERAYFRTRPPESFDLVVPGSAAS
jgi:uridine kinase